MSKTGICMSTTEIACEVMIKNYYVLSTSGNTDNKAKFKQTQQQGKDRYLTTLHFFKGLGAIWIAAEASQ